MKVTEQEAEHFFELMWGLQFFVNQQLDIDPAIESVQAYARLGSGEKMPIRDALYEHPELFDQYLTANPQQLSDADLAIVAGWKGFVKRSFYIERMLKKHAIFISGEDVYAALGLYDSFDDFFYPNQLPVAVETVLLPYQGRIVYDGLMTGYPTVYFGGGIKRDLKERYMAAKQNRRIITSLEPGAQTEADTALELRPDYSSELAELAALVRRLRAPRNGPLVWSPAFSLLRNALALAEQAAVDPDDIDKLWPQFDKTRRALDRMGTFLYRAEG